MSADQRLADLGLTLPSVPKSIGNYVPFMLAGNLLFLSGVGPRRTDETMITGKSVLTSRWSKATRRRGCAG
jgi:enamine deaminase RidA (YjgF/YER057c/UK114 family)